MTPAGDVFVVVAGDTEGRSRGAGAVEDRRPAATAGGRLKGERPGTGVDLEDRFDVERGVARAASVVG